MDSTPPNYCEEINEATQLYTSIWEGKKEGKGLGEKMKIITRRWTEDDSGLLYVFAPMQEGRGKGGKKKGISDIRSASAAFNLSSFF